MQATHIRACGVEISISLKISGLIVYLSNALGAPTQHADMML